MSSEDEGEDSVCAVCADPTWIEGNWLLLCDGAGCEQAYHTQCCVPPLSAPFTRSTILGQSSTFCTEAS